MHRAGLAVLVAVALLIAGIWAIPPLLDWSRFRHSIATIVGTEFGRSIVINGDVALQLLPVPVLTATDVDLPDPGDGTSAHLASLRLEVALGPLLRGRLAVRDLVLGSPMVSLPWPLPASLIRPERPNVPHAFAAHVENGTLRSGQAEVTGINAAIHGGPEASLAQDGPVTTFGAEGFAAFDGHRWRFTAALGAPDADNVSAVDVAVQGQGSAHDTGGAVVGTLSDGVLQGRLHASGSDLSLLIPASRLAWRAEAPFLASSDRVESSAISMRLGNSPATASFALHIAAPARLEAALHAATLDLDGWSRLVRGHVAAFAPPVPIKLAFDADSASLLGGQVRTLGGMLTYDGSQWAFDQVQAGLPGGTQLAFSGKMSRIGGTALSVQGPASLDAPDLRATIAWLRPLAPGLVQALPQGGLRTAKLSFAAHVTPDLASMTGITGSLDGAAADGQADVRLGPHPAVNATMHVARVDLDDWLGPVKTRFGEALATASQRFTAVDSKLQLSADLAVAAKTNWSHLLLNASTGPSGLRVDTLSANASGVQVKMSGALGADGTVTAARFKAIAPSLQSAWSLLGNASGIKATSLPALPGPVSLQAFADGPPDALTIQLHAEAADLTAEADSHRDTLTGTANTTLTLRHPGASFLLDMLGAKQSDRWLGLGPVAVLAHIRSAPGGIRMEDLVLRAADLQLQGQGQISLSGKKTVVDFDLAAPLLPVPALGMVAPPPVDLPALLSPWQGEIRLAAGQVEAGLEPVKGSYTATLTTVEGNALLQVNGGGKGAALSLAAAVDASRKPALAALQADISQDALAEQPVGLPLRILNGRAGLGIDLSGSGDVTQALLSSLSGSALLRLRNADIDGIDLQGLTRFFTPGAPPSRGAVQQTLTSGTSDNVSGSLLVRIDHGRLSIGENAFSSIDGSFRLAGTADFSTGLLDVTTAVWPATTAQAALSVHYSGLPGALKTSTELGVIGDADTRPEKPRKPRPAK